MGAGYGKWNGCFILQGSIYRSSLESIVLAKKQGSTAKNENHRDRCFSTFLSKGSNTAQWGTDSITTKGSGEIGRYWTFPQKLKSRFEPCISQMIIQSK